MPNNPKIHIDPKSQIAKTNWSAGTGFGKCPFLGILNITFKPLLGETKTSIVGRYLIGTFTTPEDTPEHIMAALGGPAKEVAHARALRRNVVALQSQHWA